MSPSSDEIRERFLAFFEEKGHLRLRSASLLPSSHDPSALLTVAGMHPLKPYFLGQEQPPAARLTSCQKCFRTVDIERVGETNRHLTFFEMLGNFSIGDYFKREAIAFAWELSLTVFGFEPARIWVTVFEGDEELGLGPDEEAIEHWLEVGVDRERIVLCPRSENFWQAGRTGPCGPCSELYLDRGEHLGSEGDLPGGENERFLEYWNLVFMEHLQDPPNTLSPLPAKSIDTGLGLNRMAALLQGKASVFETDQFQPLIELGERLAGVRYGAEAGPDRSLRILADHARAMSFLIADGVVPSNEERGYVLRRVMRRAIVEGRRLQLDDGFLTAYAEVVRELMSGAYPELDEQWRSLQRWLSSEEQSFTRTLEQGLSQLRFHAEHAKEHGALTIRAEDAFRLHDTFGFPFELTKELLREEGLGVDEQGFEDLMEQQRSRARRAAGAPSAGKAGDAAQRAIELAGAAKATRFTGYEHERELTSISASATMEPEVGQGDMDGNGGAAKEGIDGNGGAAKEGMDGNGGAAREGARVLLKLEASPFYAAGGGQVSDTGVIECEGGGCRATVERVLRVGDDQVIEVSLLEGSLKPHAKVIARVDHAARHATECNHTATHLLHAALRSRLGGHVHQAGSYVGPDKLRFDFTHSTALTRRERAEVEDEVNDWIAANEEVRPITTTLEEAKRLGAMALFGEKYGEIVRMVEIGDGRYSRELCGGTHVRRTAEIGAFMILSETSSAANVRRIEALTGPRAVQELRRRSDLLLEAASLLAVRPERLTAHLAAQVQELRRLREAAEVGRAGGRGGEVDVEALLGSVEHVNGAGVLISAVEAADAKRLLAIVDEVKAHLREGVIVLGSASEGRVHLIASVSQELVGRGVKAGEVLKRAAALAGGGGGGRDTMAQAGGRHPEKLGEALGAARAEIVSILTAEEARL